MFGKGLFKACGWKWQFLTILHLLTEQNVGTMHPLRLKQKNTYLLDPANVPSALSTPIHMHSQYSFHARLLTVHSNIRLAAIDGCFRRGLNVLTFAQSRKVTFLTDMTFSQQTGFVFKSFVSLPEENQ